MCNFKEKQHRVMKKMQKEREKFLKKKECETKEKKSFSL